MDLKIQTDRYSLTPERRFGLDREAAQIIEEYLTNNKPRGTKGIVKDFRRQNRKKADLKDFYGDLASLNLRTIDAFELALEQNGWKALYEQFPDLRGCLMISAPGFSCDSSHALIH